MTVDDVKKYVADIDAMRDDDENAHSLEDELHVAVLKAIADGECTDPVGCATEALKTLFIDFSRWCA